jgi:hypothetical protein
MEYLAMKRTKILKLIKLLQKRSTMQREVIALRAMAKRGQEASRKAGSMYW